MSSPQKHVNGRADISGPAVQLGCEEKYFPTCFECYNSAIEEVGETLLSKRKRAEESPDDHLTGSTIELS